jgi:hypothetical protein
VTFCHSFQISRWAFNKALQPMPKSSAAESRR